MAPQYTVTLQPIGRRVQVAPGTNLLEAAQRAGVELVASCGGLGICSTCKVRVVQGNVTPVNETEREELGPALIAQGFRLACQAEPLEDVRVDVPPESLLGGQQMQVDGRAVQMTFDPAVQALDLELTPPSLYDLDSDLTRVNEFLQELEQAPLATGPALLDALSRRLRQDGWKARVVCEAAGGANRLVSVLPYGAKVAGLAMDLGTTKLALFLMDLENGALLAQTGVMNPQISFGEDVVSRIAYASRSEEHRRQLQARLVETINQTLGELLQEHGLTREQVVDVAAVGNTAMHHLFIGLPAESLGAAPYTPVASETMHFPAREIGLDVAEGAYLYLPPNIAGYVGADHTAALWASRSFLEKSNIAMLVDIGTNTEISLISNNHTLSCSCASGPAFEGAHIRDGMRAAPGAIEKVRITGDETRLVTIGGQLPVGICGSGILNTVAELLDADILDEQGRLRKGDSRVRKEGGNGGEFLLAPAEETGHGREILVTRKDVNEIQLAKGAIRAGMEILLKEAQLQAEQVDHFIVAGAFGTHLDLASALRVGMFPWAPLEKFHQVGNAAGVGARELLLSKSAREQVNDLYGEVRYVELTTRPDFTPTFVDSMYFKLILREEKQAMDDLIKAVYTYVVEGDNAGVQEAVKAALEAGKDAGTILNEGLIAGMAEVGQLFEAGEYFVPEMLISARAMKSAMVILKPHLTSDQVGSAGKVAIGTVKGDLHDIGKNLVSLMLEGAGFQVMDLGSDVPPEKFVEVAQTTDVDIVAMSALLTTTMVNMKTSIEALEKAGVRNKVKVLIGGAPVTDAFAKQISADGYAPDASRAVAVAKMLLG